MGVATKSFSMDVIGLKKFTLVLFIQFFTTFAWMPDLRPDIPSKQDIILSSFWKNDSDYFKILFSDDTSLLLGARDAVYNISLSNLQENSRIEWTSSDADRELCVLKGKNDNDCHNYIRVFAPIDSNKIMICGTNSYKPRCRHYQISNNSIPSQNELLEDEEAQGLCPYSPSHNSTYIYTGGQLYSGTVADFSGSDPLIYRENLRTEQYDLKQLNQPDFVGAVERNDYVYFFFREISMEYMNCGKAIYSRVGRVCKNDRGGPYTLSKSWTSFLKTRLNCSVPGEYPFYFDEIQAISNIIESDSEALIYAVFTTSINAISGSAVCAFRVNDIIEAFEGRFKAQKDSQSNWLPIQNEHVPQPRPGRCVDDSRMLSSTSVNFIKNHPLMETSVSAAYGRPLLTKVNLHHRFTAITVDRIINSHDKNKYDIIYVGSDDGKITKFTFMPLNTEDQHDEVNLKTILISEHQVLPIGTPVREVMVATTTSTLVVTSDSSVVAVPLSHCSSIFNCETCLSLQDPNCAWDLKNRECIHLRSTKFSTKALIQSLNSTKKAATALCPKTMQRGTAQPTLIGMDTLTLHFAKPNTTFAFEPNTPTSPSNSAELDIINELYEQNELNIVGKELNYSENNGDSTSANNNLDEQKVALAGKSWILVSVTLSVVFIIGMGVGHYASNRFCKATASNVNHRNQLNLPHPFNKIHHRTSGKDVNLLVNTNAFLPFNQKIANVDVVGGKDRSHECNNSTENLEKDIPYKTSTLTKVKRTYI